MSGEPETSDTTAGRYKAIWADGLTEAEGLESSERRQQLTVDHMTSRSAASQAQLRTIVSRHFDGDPDLMDIVEKIAEGSVGTGHQLLTLGDADLVPSSLAAQLEVIVRTDGSRPSFMVRNGEPDLTTSPVGTWGNAIFASKTLLKTAIRCVGRIDVNSAAQGFVGTAWQVQNDVIVTNRHVLQAMGAQQSGGAWVLRGNPVIDFGHEFRAQASVGPRAITRVLFAGPDWIDVNGIDHNKLDLAVLELEPDGIKRRADQVLAVDGASDWGEPGAEIYLVGYPGRPAPGAATPTLLEQLFQQTWGCKRLAPGKVMNTPSLGARNWSLAHDATTLGGNSGSCILVAGREHIAAGLHYGGRTAPPRENWSHIMGVCLAQKDSTTGTHLGDLFARLGVEILNRQTGP